MFSYIWSKETVTYKIQKPQNNISFKGRLPIFWMEHCVECAMPTCYSTCKIYSPRIDKRCLRFNNGISKANGGEYTFLSFRKWGKLECVLPKTLKAIDTNKLCRIESITRFSEHFCKTISKLFSWYIPCWAHEHFATKFLRLYKSQYSYDISSFYGQIYLIDDKEKHLNIDLVHNSKLIYKTNKILYHGWNTIQIPISEIPLISSEGKLFFRLYFDSDETANILVSTLDFIGGDEIKPNGEQRPAPKVKCVAWDLDNTLWSGVIGDDGKDGVKVYEDSINLIKQLDERGIIQTIVSKNTYEIAWEKIKELKLEDYFLYPAINWGSKSQSLINIAKELNINIDTFAVIDDSVFERNEIAKALPQVRVYDITDKKDLLQKDEFNVPINEESKKRRLSYLNESKRKRIAANWQGDYDSFLKSCNLEMTIVNPVTQQDKDRSLELISRSNQYNVSGNRYKDSEFADFLSSNNNKCFAFKVNDTYGNYGLVGFSSFKEEADYYLMTNFVMSCRVAMKKVERAFLYNMISKVFTDKPLKINIIKTNRNEPLRSEFSAMPFRIIEEDDKHITLLSESTDKWIDDNIISVKLL